MQDADLTRLQDNVQDSTAADRDPTHTDPDNYRTILENASVRVLEYHDTPGSRTSPHRHPDSVMYTLSGFQRRLHFADGSRDVSMTAGQVFWLPAQIHAGENIGTTETRVLFVELKSSTTAPAHTTEAAPA